MPCARHPCTVCSKRMQSRLRSYLRFSTMVAKSAAKVGFLSYDSKQPLFSPLNSTDRTPEMHQRTMHMSNAKDAAISTWQPRDGWAFLFAFAVAGSASAARMVDDRLISQANQLHGTALIELAIVTLVCALLLGIAVTWLFQKIDCIRDNEEERHSTNVPPPEHS